MAEAKFFRLVGRHNGFTKDDLSDTDENPQYKGIYGGVTVTVETTRRRQVLKAANLSPSPSLISLWPIELKLDDGRLKVFADSEDPEYDQPDVRLVANCAALGLDDDEEIIYTFTPHDITANGARQTLPKFSIKAPYIPESYSESLDGEITLDWTTANWVDGPTASAPGGTNVGIPGPRGRSFAAVAVDGDGALVFELTDGTFLAPVVVPALTDAINDAAAAAAAYAMTFH